MATELNILLDLRRKKLDGTYPIVYRIIHNRKSTTIKTGYSVEKEFWDEKKLKVKRGCKSIPYHTSFNYFLKKRQTVLLEKIFELENRGVLNNISLQELKQELIRSINQNHTGSFVEYAKNVISSLKEEKRYGTATAYSDALCFLVNYSEKKDISFSELNSTLLKLLEKRYMTIPNNHYNGLATYLRGIRAIFNRAIATGAAQEQQYPFRRNIFDKYKYHIRTEKTKKRAVTKDIIRKIEAFSAERDTINRSKNYFLFSFYTMGMNFIDLARLRKRNIVNGILTYKRAKTGKTYEVKLTDKALNILNYFGYEKKRRNDLLFPIIKNPENEELAKKQVKDGIKYTNKYLTIIASELGLDVKLTTYVSRHTWATIADKAGIDRRIISQGLGHSDLKTTNIYIDDIQSINSLSDANEIITE